MSKEYITKHFARDEFACQGEDCCGHSAPIDETLVSALQELRDIVGPLRITSGFRCNKHNSSVPGAVEGSAHTKGLAADVASADGSRTPREIWEAARDMDWEWFGIGVYDSFVHLDIDESKSRRTWYGDTQEID
jgi:zinc D-Ala-D-Ala carboxypeptidase